MKRLMSIIEHPVYRECLQEIEKCERERPFCRHDLAHFLDVARIAQLLNLEEKRQVSRELIYAAALLHDIGRHRQYREQLAHETAGREIAAGILADLDFDEAEREEILTAIAAHRKLTPGREGSLAGLLYRADKQSRACFACPVEAQCNWREDKKNKTLEI